MTQVTAQYTIVFGLLNNITAKFFTLGSLMDSSYLGDYNHLLFDNLCSNASCLTVRGQDKGLNSILLNYYDYFIGKYQKILAANGTYNLTVFYPQTTQTTECILSLTQRNSACCLNYSGASSK
jgi:hypothetical protein